MQTMRSLSGIALVLFAALCIRTVHGGTVCAPMPAQTWQAGAVVSRISGKFENAATYWANGDSTFGAPGQITHVECTAAGAPVGYYAYHRDGNTGHNVVLDVLVAVGAGGGGVGAEMMADLATRAGSGGNVHVRFVATAQAMAFYNSISGLTCTVEHSSATHTSQKVGVSYQGTISTTGGVLVRRPYYYLNTPCSECYQITNYGCLTAEQEGHLLDALGALGVEPVAACPVWAEIVHRTPKSLLTNLNDAETAAQFPTFVEEDASVLTLQSARQRRRVHRRRISNKPAPTAMCKKKRPFNRSSLTGLHALITGPAFA